VSDETWAEFRQEAFGDPYMVWHDGPDFADFRDHVRADPARVEQLLLAGLGQGDGLAAQSMGDSATSEGPFDEAARARFVTALEAALPASAGGFRVEVARALIALTDSQEWSAALVDVLAGGGHSARAFWGERLDAAMAIGQLTPTVALIGALMVGMNDPEYLVRYHSTNSMLRFAGRTDDVSEDGDLFKLIVEDSRAADWKKAAADLSKDASARL
jgi:hypothetical protein